MSRSDPRENDPSSAALRISGTWFSRLEKRVHNALPCPVPMKLSVTFKSY